MAQARLSSALSGNFSIQLCENSRLLSTGESTQFVVTFHKGLGSRRTSTFTETLELLNAEKIRSVVNLILSDKNDETRETLRSNHMAGCSPRVFWSIVKLHGGNVEAGLRLLLPDKDWNWMSSRRRTLSDKAKNNLQQLQTKQKKTQKENSEDCESVSVQNTDRLDSIDTYKDIFKKFCTRLSNMINLSEIVYYRLQQFDIDGKYETFGPIVITRDVKNKQIIGYINLLGQKVDPKYATGVILEVYEDGTMIKKIR